MHKFKLRSTFIYKIIKFSLIYLFFINFELFNNRNLKAEEINLNSCHWIPIRIKKKSQKKIRYCLSNNQKDLYKVRFNFKNKKVVSKKFVGKLNGIMVYKGKNILNQNQDTLIKLKNNNGKLYFYKCVRKDCYDNLSNYQTLGIKKYFWKNL